MLKAMVVECTYLFLYPTSMHAVCMCVKRPTHLQLLISSWLVLLHQKWKLVPSLKQERENTWTEWIPTCPWNEDIVKTGQLAMSTPWQQTSESLPACVRVCPSPVSTCPSQRLSVDASSSLLPAQLQVLHVDGNETVPTIAKNTIS